MKALLHRSCSVALLLLVLVAIPAVFLVEAAADDPSSTLGSSDTGTHPSQYSTDDELSVTSGRCAPASATEGDIGPCTSGSVLTLTGTGLTSATTVVIGRTTDQQSKIQCGSPTANDQGTQLTCTLTIDNSIADGEYPIAVGSSGTTGGNVMTGTFLQQTIAGWDNHELTAAQYLVAGVSDLWPSTGDEWTVYGNFDTSKAYKVLFYNTEEGVAAKNNGKTPTCTSPTLTSNSLQCTITVEPSVMGMWGILVQEESSGAYLPVPKSLNGTIAVNPPLPTVTSATGDCADDSSKCVSGAELTLVGTNFNQQAAKYNNIIIGASSGSSFTCTPKEVTATSLTCTLDVAAGAVAGSYDIAVEVHVCSMGMPSPAASAGTFVYGEKSGTPGWSSHNNGGAGTCGPSADGKPRQRPSNVAAIALAVVFGVCFLAALVAILVLVVRCRFVPRRAGDGFVRKDDALGFAEGSNAPDYFAPVSAMNAHDNAMEMQSRGSRGVSSYYGDASPHAFHVSK